jgi:hypothetical protein
VPLDVELRGEDAADDRDRRASLRCAAASERACESLRSLQIKVSLLVYVNLDGFLDVSATGSLIAVKHNRGSAQRELGSGNVSLEAHAFGYVQALVEIAPGADGVTSEHRYHAEVVQRRPATTLVVDLVGNRERSLQAAARFIQSTLLKGDPPEEA